MNARFLLVIYLLFFPSLTLGEGHTLGQFNNSAPYGLSIANTDWTLRANVGQPTSPCNDCSCGWCEGGPSTTFGGAFDGCTILLGVQVCPSGKEQKELLSFPTIPPWVTQPSPTCAIDPCACGWCTGEPNDSSKPQFPIQYQDLLSNTDYWLYSQSTSSMDEIFNMAWASLEESEVVRKVNLASHELGISLVDTGTYCPDQARRPWYVMRESYLSRGEMQVCTTAVNALDAFQAELRERVGIDATSRQILMGPDDLLKPGFDDYRDAAHSVFRNYRNSCLRNLGELTNDMATTRTSESNILRNSTAPGSTEALMASIGVLSEVDANRDSCSATLVQINNSPHLVTAVHCIGSERETSEGMRLDSVWSELTFTAYSGQTLSVEVSTELEGLVYDGDRTDIIAVPVILSDDMQILEIATTALEPWEPMLIVGRNPYLEALARFEGTRGQNLVRESISITFSADCRANASVRGVLRYNCQTAGGTSGAAIIVLREGRFVFAGIHLGDTGRAPHNLICLGGVPNGGSNRGISLRMP